MIAIVPVLVAKGAHCYVQVRLVLHMSVQRTSALLLCIQAMAPCFQAMAPCFLARDCLLICVCNQMYRCARAIGHLTVG